MTTIYIVFVKRCSISGEVIDAYVDDVFPDYTTAKYYVDNYLTPDSEGRDVYEIVARDL